MGAWRSGGGHSQNLAPLGMPKCLHEPIWKALCSNLHANPEHAPKTYKKYCMQSNQLQPKTPVELLDNPCMYLLLRIILRVLILGGAMVVACSCSDDSNWANLTKPARYLP